jgi:hypothetical protein
MVDEICPVLVVEDPDLDLLAGLVSPVHSGGLYLDSRSHHHALLLDCWTAGFVCSIHFGENSCSFIAVYNGTGKADNLTGSTPPKPLFEGLLFQQGQKRGSALLCA